MGQSACSPALGDEFRPNCSCSQGCRPGCSSSCARPCCENSNGPGGEPRWPSQPLADDQVLPELKRDHVASAANGAGKPASVKDPGPDGKVLLELKRDHVASVVNGAGKPASLKDPRPDGKVSVSEYCLTLANVLDIFSLCSRSLQALRAAVETEASIKSRIACVAAAAVGGQGEVAAVLPHVKDNLTEVGDLPSFLERWQAGADGQTDAKDFLRCVLDQSHAWTFDGGVDTAPKLTDTKLLKLRISQEALADVRRLACAHVPSCKQGYRLSRTLREQQFGSARSSDSPVVVITVGPPGSGKSWLLKNRCVSFLEESFGAPSLGSYVSIDPDYFISELLENNNLHREMANFLNHESLMCAIGQKCHVLFDHTGKDPVNTCGRCISRFKEAGYRVYMCIVLASFETCQKRVQDRFDETGRTVPEAYIRVVFQSLLEAVPHYLRMQEQISDAILFYTNDYGSAASAPEVITAGVDEGPAIEMAQSILELPPASS